MTNSFTPVWMFFVLSISLAVSCSKEQEGTSELASGSDVVSMFKVSDNQWKVICNYGKDGLQEELTSSFGIDHGVVCTKNNPQDATIEFDKLSTHQVRNEFKLSVTRNGNLLARNDSNEIKPVLRFSITPTRPASFVNAALMTSEIILPGPKDHSGDYVTVIKSISTRLFRHSDHKLPSYNDGKYISLIRHDSRINNDPEVGNVSGAVTLTLQDGTSKVLYASNDPYDHNGIKIYLREIKYSQKNYWWKPQDFPHDPDFLSNLTLRGIIVMEHANGDSESISFDGSGVIEMPLRELNDKFSDLD